MQSPVAFEWREVNEAIHLEKHGIWFDFAIGVFLDPHRIEQEDTRGAYDAPRFNTVGLVDGNLHQRDVRRRRRCRDHHLGALRASQRKEALCLVGPLPS